MLITELEVCTSPSFFSAITGSENCICMAGYLTLAGSSSPGKKSITSKTSDREFLLITSCTVSTFAFFVLHEVLNIRATKTKHILKNGMCLFIGTY